MEVIIKFQETTTPLAMPQPHRIVSIRTVAPPELFTGQSEPNPQI